MSDNGEEEAEPVVELGDGPDVEGAPVARVASRLFFPIEESEVRRREGETTVRTPDGPRDLGDVLGETDEVYFETSADLVDAVRSVVGTGPVPTAGGGSDGSTTADASAGEAEGDAGEGGEATAGASEGEASEGEASETRETESETSADEEEAGEGEDEEEGEKAEAGEDGEEGEEEEEEEEEVDAEDSEFEFHEE